VNPEVSSLDSANGLTIQGYTIPGLDTRRIQTEVELQNGQSFMIAGLLDNRLTETISKIPGLGDIPILGKLFESRGTQRNNSELMVLVTPEIVEPIPAGKLPELQMPKPFMKDVPTVPPQNPVAAGKNSSLKVNDIVPVEVLRSMQQSEAAAEAADSGPNGSSGANAQQVNQVLQSMQPTPINH
jgi:pilus assembly protein CpaC